MKIIIKRFFVYVEYLLKDGYDVVILYNVMRIKNDNYLNQKR